MNMGTPDFDETLCHVEPAVVALPPGRESAGRLAGIDALRGAAALGVVLFHAARRREFTAANPAAGWLANLPVALVSVGYSGVFLFFVISGFCIHLRWGRALADGAASDLGFVSFWKRRFRRLYPPYLAAFGLFLVVLALQDEVKISRFFIYDVTMHLTMLHNLDFRTTYTLNGVFWTLAIEEQLYLAYFLLVWLRRRFGWGVALTFCLAVRYLWYGLHYFVLGRTGLNVPVGESAAANWFTWALGALSVECLVGSVKLPPWTRSLTLGVAVIAAAAWCDHLLRFQNQGSRAATLWSLFGFPVWGVGYFVLVNYVVWCERRWRAAGRVPWTVSVFAGLGLFSYSLYLTHELITFYLERQILPVLGLSRNGELLFATTVRRQSWCVRLRSPLQPAREDV